MLGHDTDLTVAEDVERFRRSVAMLPANSYQRVLSREEVLRLSGALVEALRAVPQAD